MTIYKKFISSLIVNYCVGMLMAGTAGVALLMISPPQIPAEERLLFIGIHLFSGIVMIVLGWGVYHIQLRPIRNCFVNNIESFGYLQSVYIRTHRLPSLVAKRIMGPHLIGYLLPSTALCLWFTHTGQLTINYYQVFLTAAAAILVTGMHALIEFYMTSNSIHPVLLELNNWSYILYEKELSLHGRVLISIKSKLRWSLFVIVAVPLLLYSMAIEYRYGGDIFINDYFWRGAAAILCVGLAFAFIGSRLMTRDTVTPIQLFYEKMAEVHNGYLRSGVSDLFSDEFSRLVSGFNHMMRGLKIQAERNNQLLESYFSTLAAALDARDPYTAGHSERVAEYAVRIGRLANLPEKEIQDLRKSALLHDIGKIGIKDAVLLKEGRLTEEEWDQIKQHPVLGEAILKQIEPVDAMASFLPGVRSHHERYDGAGYPDGLSGEDIPLFGRIIAVADAFDAMTSDRPYRKGMDEEKAIAILEEGGGTQWDPYFSRLFTEDYRKMLAESAPQKPLPYERK
ncbi:HD-GYP domain-containing protein [Paenibacillus antibioticophila]|uniref:HD-GYP domain-containing protein n=1 Tax=Paenibacillus antibioticophila TaxID=1274374 RepID=UPI0005C9C028|nr:HD domain-containing phosphohydrolase [Paenibacillus antibioticophila]